MKKTILAAAAFVFVAASAASMATPSFAQSYNPDSDPAISCGHTVVRGISAAFLPDGAPWPFPTAVGTAGTSMADTVDDGWRVDR